MIRAVLDVNVLVSAALNDRGLPARIADLAFDELYDLVVFDQILDMLAEVFQRPYMLQHMSPEARDRVLRALAVEREPIEPDESVRGIAPDLEDDLVLGTAVAARADFLVTGDKGLLAIGEYWGERIVSAAEFLREMEEA